MPATAIIVPFEEAGIAVDRWRLACTGDGADGMPPHVTLLHPFIEEEALGDAHVDSIARVVRSFESFDVTLGTMAEFRGPERSVLYLAPDRPERFVAMIRALTEAFPDHPPYGGAHPDLVPHLTVAVGPPTLLRAARAQLEPFLPITARAEEAWLMRHDGRAWSRWTGIRLGRAQGEAR